MMPFLVRVAANYNLEDRPDEKRKKHEKPISSLGGMGIFLGAWFSLLFVDVFQIHILPKVAFQLYALSSIMIILGILDDMLNIKPLKKLIVQIVIAVLSVFWLHNDIIKLFTLNIHIIPVYLI
jgi:UDP-GlcNAc:undecaprenyl-phosphate GlcNAc-1-phosphate transferase